MARPDRVIFLDTETTGLDPKAGHRLIEVACVEAIGRQLTGRVFHRYINPERSSDDRALEIHGLTDEFLSDKPRFRDIAEELLAFISGAQLYIHNAAFDVGFLDAELSRLGLPCLADLDVEIVDTMALARSLYPGKKNSLDALCERLGVNNAERKLHGALLDARLLAEVYFAMTRGQVSLDMGVDASASATNEGARGRFVEPVPIVRIEVGAEAMARHEAYLEGMRANCIWRA